jgi:uncharacterized protein (TIGR03435 family)
MTRPLVCVVFLGAATLNGQTPSPAPTPLAFEVASVKPATPPTGPLSFGAPSPDRFVLPFIPLRGLIANAYQMQDWQLFNVPGWAQTAFFSINAKIPEGVGRVRPQPGEPAPVMLMLRSLLAERFQLKAHMEKRELQAYRLVLARQDGKLGPNLKPTQIDCAALFSQMRASGQRPAPPEPGKPTPCGMQMGPARIIGSSRPITELARILQGQLRGPVSDRTGLTGTFDFDLSWTPEQLPPRPPGSPTDGPIRMGPFTIDPNGPSLITAIQEQLGLKLEPAKELVEVLVIDSVSQPTPD